ncbi:cytochrome b/b6 domain-containing protein [Nocardioides insulae]|uniref:cytochrome b/b6 domain-containing protein n=1 Tax=Nocardioides insulae TaxID=394734 RepID=UPI00040A32EF|nr:cytochrome b/b6 domain-containing protein [Nocardioides insulae]
MRLRNGPHGYGAVTKTLHWSTVLAFAAQFGVGYLMSTETDVPEVECDPPGEGRSGGDTTDAEQARLDRLEERCEAGQDRLEDEADDTLGTAWAELTSGGDGFADGLSLPETHILLGLLILGLALLRLVWRASTPLPPWSPRLNPTRRRLVQVTERTMLSLQVAVPVTGLVLIAGGPVWVHIGGHLAFFAALAVHVGTVVGNRLLPRMLPGGGTSYRAREAGEVAR